MAHDLPGRVTPFTPSAEIAASTRAADDLVARTVGRDDLLNTIEGRLRTAAATGNRAHTLIIGPFGAGKTHVVEVALQRLARDPDASQRIVPVRIGPDALGITRYADVLNAVVTVLRADGPVDVDTAPAATEADIRALLGGRVLLLVIENLDRVFAAIGGPGQQELRGWVETSRDVVVLATAPELFDGVQRRDLPWFGGFSVEHLPEFTTEQVHEVLVHVAGRREDAALADFLTSDVGRARVDVLTRMIGGSPRLCLMAAEHLTPESLDAVRPVVDSIVEALVPYHRQLLWALSGNEERIVAVMAKADCEGATVREIAAAAGVEQRAAAATLGRLVDVRWVSAEKFAGTDQRTTWYRLRDPLLRYHCQYRSGEGRSLALTIAILRAFFDPPGRGEADDPRVDQRRSQPAAALSRAAAAGDDDPLAAAFVAAADGSAQALVRLPLVLRDVAVAVRADLLATGA